MTSTSFVYPVFTKHLSTKFGISVEVASIFFIITMVSYFIALQFLNDFSNKVGVKLTISIGLLLNVVFTPFLAPVRILPQNIFIIIFGFIILGITGACITVPGIVDFMDSMKNKMGIDEAVANDVAGGK